MLVVVLSVHCCRTLTEVNLTAACNVNCGCVPDVFEPVCGADNLIYFSPCYAGCHNTSADRKVVDSVQTINYCSFYFKPANGCCTAVVLKSPHNWHHVQEQSGISVFPYISHNF